ncbi:Response regulator rcp1 [subsurface metagenome]
MLNILLIEDEPEHRTITRLVLEDRLGPFRLMEVEDGLDGMKYMQGRGKYRNRSKYPLPDIILLDIRMPKVDGFEFMEEISGNRLMEQIPVIIISTSTQEQEISRAFSLGAYAYITKPINFDKLVEKIISARDAKR